LESFEREKRKVENREVVNLPAVGEIKGRPGTSTMELAGMASYWHKKFLSARKEGRIEGATALAALCLVAEAVYQIYIRSH
jgi:hypothetical protein